MEYELYLDVFFIINFMMNRMLLCVVKKVLKLNSTAWRMNAGSALGAVWACLAAVFPVFPRPVEVMAVLVGAGGLMVMTAFKPADLRSFVRDMAGLYLATVTAGGIFFVLSQETRAGYYIEQIYRGETKTLMAAVTLGLYAGGAYLGSRLLLEYGMIFKRRSHCMYQVTLYYRGREKTVTALLDTGNRLRDPYGGEPVSVMTYEACHDLCDTVSQVLYIPFCSVGKEKGMLPAIRMDRMVMKQEGKTVAVVEKPLVAVVKQPLSATGEYQMLLHEERQGD